MEDVSTKRAVRLQNSIDQALLAEVEKKMDEKNQALKDNDSRIRQKKGSEKKVVIFRLFYFMNTFNIPGQNNIRT